jgi:hypothetical protein
MWPRVLRFMLVVFPVLFLVVSWAGARQIPPRPMTSQNVAASSKNPATLAQLMRGIMFPNSNVIFAAQSKKFVTLPSANDPAAATDPIAGTYGHWEAFENSSLAIVEAANLLTVPGRVCSNGRPVPINNPDWPQLVQGLRDAGMQSYEAAKSKDHDKILDTTDKLTTACGNCHVKYRDKEKPEDRCR